MNPDIHGKIAAYQFKYALCNINSTEHTAVLGQVVCLAGVLIVQEIICCHIDIVAIFLQRSCNQAINIGLL